MNYKKSTADAGRLLTFIIWPFWGFIVNFFKKPSKVNAFIFTAFCGLAGYFFKLSEPEYDSYRYALEFKEAVVFGISHFIEQRQLEGMIDFYSIFSYSFVKSFTSDPHILFAFWGCVFGYFMYMSLCFIKKYLGNCKDTLFIYGLLVLMFMINPYININGVRYWTAIWVFLAGWLGYEVHNKKKWLLVMCVTPIVHTTFIIPLVIYVVYKTKVIQNLKVLYFAYIISFIIGNVVDLEIIVDYIPFLEMSERYSTYVDTDFANTVKHSFIFKLLQSHLPNYFILLFMTWLYASKKMFKYDKNDILTKVLQYTLLMLCICSITQSIPGMGRFDKLCNLLFFFILIIYKHRDDIKTNYLLPIIVIVFYVRILNVWYIHDDLISFKYLLPFAYLF